MSRFPIVSLTFLGWMLGGSDFGACEATAAAPPAPKEQADDPLPPGAIARIGTRRFRHTSPIEAVAFSADGKEVVVAGGTDLLRFDCATGKQTASFPFRHGHRMALSPDGSLLAFDTYPIGMEVMDTATGKTVRKLKGPNSGTDSLMLSRDNRLLASTHGQAVWMWDLRTGKAVHKLELPDLGLNHGGAPAFSPDGELLACAAGHGRIYLWRISSEELVRTIIPKEKCYFGNAVFSPDSLVLATWHNSCGIDLWDVKTGEHLQALPGDKSFGWSFAFASGNTLAAFRYAAGIDLWDIDTGKITRSFAASPARDGRMALSPDGKMLAFGGTDHAVRLFDTKTGHEINPRQNALPGAVRTAVLADGKTLVTWGREAFVQTTTFRFWDLKGTLLRERTWKAKEVNEYVLDLARDGSSVLVSPGLVMGGTSWDVRLSSLDGTKDHNVFAKDGFDVHDVRMNSDCKAATMRLTKTQDAFDPDRFNGPLPASTIETWRRSSDGSWKHARTIEGEQFCQTSDGRRIVTLLGHGKQQFLRADGGWTQPTPAPLAYLNAISPSGRLVVGTTYQREPLFIETASAKIVARLAKAESFGPAFAFSPRGNLLACGHPTGVIILFDGLSGKELGRLEGHGGWFTGLHFSGDGRTLLSGNYDTTALIWDLRPWHEKLRPQASEHSAKEIEELWRGLKSQEAERGYQSAAALVRSPKETVAWLAKHLRPVRAADLAPAEELIAKLDHARYAVRQRAMTDLEQLGETALPALRQALPRLVNLEAQRRSQQLVARIEAQPASAETLRILRALDVLEQSATPESRRFLQQLSEGIPEARVTREARAALERLAGEH